MAEVFFGQLVLDREVLFGKQFFGTAVDFQVGMLWPSGVSVVHLGFDFSSQPLAIES